MFTLSEAAILSTVLEGILYGFSVLMFIFTMWIMSQNRRRRSLNKGMLSAACALLILSTAEMINNVVRLREGVLTVGPNEAGGPEDYFANVTARTFVIKSVLYNAQTLILDFAVIYRAYIVWQSVYVVIVPVLGWCGLFAACVGTNVSLATASAEASDVFAVQTGRWITANYSMTLATNVMSTSLLAFRIWQVKRQSRQYLGTNALSPLLRVVIESGAIYSMTVTAALITFATKSNGVYVVLDILSPIISIVFNMIIVRVGLARDQALSGGSAQQHTSTRAGGSSFGFRQSRPPYGAPSLAVEITQFIETDDGASDRASPLALKPKSSSISSAQKV
ncbi:hypothetical protein PHLGIDRAFT_112895 [Phlebiopsis gigantea 11061_1 CR5-6]|uniref:Uncharacterized protein n=1 Tax=Phlebiopsis gigantea (strain 11061_1 CR5-6) TaxID=745531 RepID=A0A0C3NAV4_PHLG1|nr:hypothetical protein PHLGIDRAFT_112895 [Phlebiopsis gigantea 11061_1 CR5-6]